MRVFAISDIHIDFKQNRLWLDQLSDVDYREDALMLAGDVSNHVDRLEATLRLLTHKFARVFFVPGNHDLWVRGDDGMNSEEKFHALLALCEAWHVSMVPEDFGTACIVPLFSWYRKPEEGADSLFAQKEGEDASLRMWADHQLIRWPSDQSNIADFFLDYNTSRLQQETDKPILSFSHFLPRRDLIYRTEVEKRLVTPGSKDAHPTFNFSRVAGTSMLDRQIRTLGSVIHVYGHQHHNRHRVVDGVTYISHCLGYHRERQAGIACQLDEGPKQVWPVEP